LAGQGREPVNLSHSQIPFVADLRFNAHGSIRSEWDKMEQLLEGLPEQRAPETTGRGAPRLVRAERRQVELRPISLDDMIGPEHLARLVWQMVQRFDLQPLLDRILAREGVAGHPQTDPAILVSLWLYATLDGVGSARELARLCAEHVAYRWLSGGVGINYHTLSDFRVDHTEWLDRELVRGLTGLMASGAVDVQTVAQDGLRVRASAGGSSFRREPKLRELECVARARVAALKPEVSADPPPRPSGLTPRQAAEKRAATERLARVEAALAAMPEARMRKKRNKGEPNEARVSTTDAEARVMKMPDGGFRPAYNVQFCAETQQGLVMGVMVTTSGADQDALDPMHRKMTEAYGKPVANVLVDGGYVSQAGFERVTERGSAIYAPLGTTMVGSTSQPIIDWRARMETEDAKTLYRLRGQTIEWVNACVRNNGFYKVTVRGQAKVLAVALWHALSHNVRCMLTMQTVAAAA
jgi:transposase